MKYYVRTYGCQMNVADSNEMGRHLEARGFAPTENPDEASVMVINTCTVRQHAEDRGFSEVGRLKRWKAARPGRKLVVTGCAAERTKEEIEGRFPHIDLVAGAKSIEDFGLLVDALLARLPTDEALDYAAPAGDKVSAFVTTMRGCNYSCTYCIVPYVRGREIYHPIDRILGEVRDRVAEGAREITLLGQTVNSYHRDGARGKDTDFADLLDAVSGVDGVERVRFMSPHPHYMSRRVIETMAARPEVCESLHLPVQSGSNPILKKMLRNYTREQYLALVEDLRRAMPGMTIGTDIIVGFPGETESDFHETLLLIEEARFDWGYIFKYSAREGTAAAAWDSHPRELIEERHQECLASIDRMAAEKRSAMLGRMEQVLIEEDQTGRARTNYRVRVNRPAVPGETISVQITAAMHPTLEGVAVSV